MRAPPRTAAEAANADACPLFDLMGLCAFPLREIRMAKGQYTIKQDVANAAHLLNEPKPAWPGLRQGTTLPAEEYEELLSVYRDWRPQWRSDCGPMSFASGVSLVCQEVVHRHVYNLRGLGRQRRPARLDLVHFGPGAGRGAAR